VWKRRLSSAQFQGKDSTDIPDEVYNKLRGEIKKNRIEDMNTLTNQKMREFLKKHKLNKYCEHINYLSTAWAPTPTRPSSPRPKKNASETPSSKQIQGIFAESANAKTKRNFISYSHLA
jgi:hypothetical protein